MYSGIKAATVTINETGVHYTWEKIDIKEIEEMMKHWKSEKVYGEEV